MRKWMAIVGAGLLVGSLAGCPPDSNRQNQPRTGQSGSSAAGGGTGSSSGGSTSSPSGTGSPGSPSGAGSSSGSSSPGTQSSGAGNQSGTRQ